MSEPELLLEREDGYAVLTLNRPRSMNALSPGPSRAREAHFTGNFISAAQADNWGLVSRVVAPEVLGEECRKLAMDIASCVPETVKVYKQMVNDGLNPDLAAGMAMERSVMVHANRGVSGGAVARRRSAVQQRGQAQNKG